MNQLPQKMCGSPQVRFTTKSVEKEWDKLSEFYSSTVNPLRKLRKCSAFSSSTLKKFIERVKCILNYCGVRHPERKLDLNVIDEVYIIQEYTTYEIEEPRLTISTVVRTSKNNNNILFPITCHVNTHDANSMTVFAQVCHMCIHRSVMKLEFVQYQETI
jgi:predicted component of type VI protein secretion system